MSDVGVPSTFRKVLVPHDAKKPHKRSDDLLVPLGSAGKTCFIGTESGHPAETGRVVYLYRNVTDEILKICAAKAGKVDMGCWPKSEVVKTYLAMMSKFECGNLVKIANTPGGEEGFVLQLVAEAPKADLSKSIRRLRSHAKQLPIPRRLPTEGELKEVEARLGRNFHPDFRRYLLEASDVWYGHKSPVTIVNSNSHTFLERVAESAWNGYGVPTALLPVCEDNADFYCMNDRGQVVFWSHDGSTEELWGNLAIWIDAVWLGGEKE